VTFVTDRSKAVLSSFPYYSLFLCVFSVFVTISIHVVSLSLFCDVRVAVCCLWCVSCMTSFLKFMIEPYCTIINYAYLRKWIALFRCSSHDLMIEKGRHHDTHKEDRNCIYCECVLEDTFDFLLVCPLYNCIKLKYIDDFLEMTYAIKNCFQLSCKN